VTEANDTWLEGRERLEGAPILPGIDRKQGGGFPQFGFASQEVHVRQHITCNAHSIRFPEEHDVAGSVTRRMYHAHPGQLIALPQNTSDQTRRPCPKNPTLAQRSVVWQHRNAAFDRRQFFLMASQRRVEMVANKLSRPLMVRVTMG
jgi:hypothetical protein